MKARTAQFPRAALSALAACLIAFAVPVFALDVPDMNGPVNDRAGVMSESERAELVSYLSDVNAQTGVQIAVLTVKSLEGEAIESYSMKVAEKWKLGQADKDNGALLLVAIDDRALRIEVGYGLEPTLTDAKSGLIIRNKIVPWFKSGNYGEGIIEGAKSIAAVATGNEQIGSGAETGDGATPAQPAVSGDSFDAAGAVAMLFFIVLFFILRAGVASRFARRRSSGPNAWFWLFLLGLMSSDSNRHNRHGGFGGFSSGSGSGFSGGGFSGGGGGFGGGGSSGSW